MTAEILCIGTEVLIGDIVNTNAAYIARRLSESGINVYYHSVCGDNNGRMKECLDLALSRSDLVITTGGLGPTYDDITKEMVAEKLGLELVLDENILAKLQEYFSKSGRVMTENNKKQAYIPKGAHVFSNMLGTADGIAVTKDNKMVIMLPGPPREMKPMLDNQVIPYLAAESDHILVSSNVNIFGMGESSVENALADLMKNSTNPTVAPYCGNGEVRLRVTARGKDEKEARALIAPVVDKIKEVIGGFVYGVDVPSIESVVVEKLKERHMTVAFAESCTGGLISKRITDVPGASEVFGFGFCTYANEAKMKILGVKEETLAAHGAVSEETASEMA
ncbi:MAG: competence/damage-inducible protein A, partial [Clostridia bacterium]|nr:competence/damage-inducible protein A [Clostridia bacterium]